MIMSGNVPFVVYHLYFIEGISDSEKEIYVL